MLELKSRSEFLGRRVVTKHLGVHVASLVYRSGIKGSTTPPSILQAPTHYVRELHLSHAPLKEVSVRIPSVVWEGVVLPVI